MRRIGAAVRFLVREVGPLVVFWLLAWPFGTKAAIAGAVAFIVGDVIYRHRRRVAFTRLYVLSSALTVVFGSIDLLSSTPFMLKYESVVTNAATGVAFVIGAGGAKPMVQELAEQRQKSPFPERPDIRRFFQLFTLVWGSYFFATAAVYFWLGQIMPLAQAMAVRSVAGGVSLALMIAVSVTQGRRLFALCHSLGLLPAAAEQNT
jgi:intracellular septation protein A